MVFSTPHIVARINPIKHNDFQLEKNGVNYFHSLETRKMKKRVKNPANVIGNDN
jgi:hypothetical protein